MWEIVFFFLFGNLGSRGSHGNVPQFQKQDRNCLIFVPPPSKKWEMPRRSHVKLFCFFFLMLWRVYTLFFNRRKQKVSISRTSKKGKKESSSLGKKENPILTLKRGRGRKKKRKLRVAQKKPLGFLPPSSCVKWLRRQRGILMEFGCSAILAFSLVPTREFQVCKLFPTYMHIGNDFYFFFLKYFCIASVRGNKRFFACLI